MRFTFFIILLAALGFVACNNDDQSIVENTIEFRVNPERVGPAIADSSLGITFQPPASCVKMPASFVNEVQAELVKQFAQSDDFSIEPAHIFIDEQNSFVCLISTLPDINSDSTAEDYEADLYETWQENDVEQTEFIHNGFNIYQTLVMSPIRVQFILVVPQPRQPSFRIDYIIPKENYSGQIKAIESSIGSLNSL